MARKDPLIVFGLNARQRFHAFRHVDEAGVDRDAVRDAIIVDLGPRMELLQVSASLGFTVVVLGMDLEYTAHRITETLINVGRIKTTDNPTPRAARRRARGRL